jgi:hypothetical protein
MGYAEVVAPDELCSSDKTCSHPHQAVTTEKVRIVRGGPNPIPGVFHSGDMYRKRWRHVQHLANQFWSRWLKEYLPELQKRTKSLTQRRNVSVGDLVLIMDENSRNLWPLGLVVDVKYGRDGLVRTVHVKSVHQLMMMYVVCHILFVTF